MEDGRGYGSVIATPEEMQASLEDVERSPTFRMDLKNRKVRTSRLMSFLGTAEKHKQVSKPHIDYEHSTYDQLENLATEEDIDAAIDVIAGTEAGSSCIRQAHPHRSWLWRQWVGTVFVTEGYNALGMMGFAAAISIVVPMLTQEGESLNALAVENGLDAFHSLWGYMLTLTTFILTFYLSQAYTLWMNIYMLFRMVQGRLNDLSMLMASHAARDPVTLEYTPGAWALLKDMAAVCRLYSIFGYASTSNRFLILHTPRALKRMVERGILPKAMYRSIVKLKIKNSARVHMINELIMIKLQQGLTHGHLKGGDGFESIFLDRACLLRSQYATFGDILDARIPLAYAHIVQIMVDTLLICAPFSLYSQMGTLCIPATGIITVFFSGLLNLAKVMFDPMNNENFCDNMVEINIGVFIRESNEASSRWWKGAEYLPEGWWKPAPGDELLIG